MWKKVIPLLGTLRNPPYPRISVAGESCSRGFKLLTNVMCDPGKPSDENVSHYFFAEEKDFRENERSGPLAQKIMPEILYIFSVLICWFFIALQHSPTYLLLQLAFGLAGGFFLFSWICFMDALLLSRDNRKEHQQWHACEHKACVLLEAEMPPTTSMLAACPKTLYRCGSVWGLLIIQIATFVWIAYAQQFGIISLENPWGVFAGIMLASSCIALCLVCYGGYLHHFPLLFLLFFALSLPALLFPLCVERTCALAEPSEQQLEATARELSLITPALYTLVNAGRKYSSKSNAF